MKVTVKNQYENIKKAQQSFSWTALIFGAFVPFFRGDWSGLIKWVLINIILGAFTCGIVTFISHLVMACQHNTQYADKLTQKGYKVVE